MSEMTASLSILKSNSKTQGLFDTLKKMVNASHTQKKMNELQNSESFSDIFGKLVSGKSGYKAVIEVSKPQPKCEKCSNLLEGNEKFCPECGNKLK